MSHLTEASVKQEEGGGGSGDGGIKPPPRLRKASSRLVVNLGEGGPEKMSGEK